MPEPARATDAFAQLDKLFQAALERRPEERSAFLREACAHDETLRMELESLLAHDRPDDSFLAPPPAGEAARAVIAMQPEPALLEAGSRIGPYRIVEQIGRGGMGVVYRAEQEHPVRRQVALKVIKPGMDSEPVIRRFDAERQALALMDHPNIARVFDAGTTISGRLYFAMELVDGLPLCDYCEKHALRLRARLELFCAICQAIQHAHQKGIIHRDIKPSNVLVAEYDGKPVAKAIDFGIAKAMGEPLTGQSMHTQLGAMMGTPAYMSPEQAGSLGQDIDTRSDVYSLGAVLYELLAGTTPLGLEGQAPGPESQPEWIRRIREEPPRPPSTRLRDQKLAGAVRGDLDWIAMKALDKDRARRYASAGALGEDIENYLEGRPVAAGPPSAFYRMTKMARRHRPALITAGAFLLVLLAAAAVIIRETIRAQRDSAIARAVNEFLQQDLLAQASPAAQALTGKPDLNLTVRTALDRAAARIEGRFEREPEEEAAIRSTVGQTYFDLGLYPAAGKQFERALILYRRVFGAENPKTIETMHRLASIAFQQGHYREAAERHTRTLELSRRALGPQHPDTLAAMAALAMDEEELGSYAQAEKLQSETLEMQRRVLGPEHPDTVKSMGALAIVYYRELKYPQAVALYRQTVEIERRQLGVEHPTTLRFMNNLALAYFDQSEFAQAEALQRETLAIERRVLGSEHQYTLHAINNLANDYVARGKYAEAEALYTEALGVQRRVLGPEHPETLISISNLAWVYFLRGRRAEAEALLEQSLKAKLRVRGPEHPNTLYTIACMAMLYQREGRYHLAETYAAQALAGRRRVEGVRSRYTLDSEADVALAWLSQAKFAASEPLAREVLALDRTYRPDDWQRFRAETLLGASLAGEKKYAEAEPLLVEGYRGMLSRKDRMKVEDWYHIDRAGEWLGHLYQVWGHHQVWGDPEKDASR